MLKKKPIIILLKSSKSMQINTEQQKPLFLLHLTFCVSMCFSNISCFFFLTSCCSFRASCVIRNGDRIQFFCSTYKSLPLQISIHFSPVSSSKLPLRSFVLSSGQQDCTQSLWVPWTLNTPETERKQLHLQEKENILKGTQRLLNTEWRLTFSIGAAGFVQKPRRSFTDSLVGFCTKGVWGGGQKGGKCLYRPRANFDKYTQQNTSSARPPTHTCEAAPDSWPGPEFWGSMGPRRSLTDCFTEVAGGCWKTKTVYNCEMEGILADK